MDDKSPRVSAGTVVAGKYRVERTLAESRMAVVLLARQLEFDRSVVVKVLCGEVTISQEAMARFASEAKAIAKLRGDHVAHIFNAGATEDGMPYVATEYQQGQSLAHVLQARGRLDVPTAVEYAIEACEGLAEAHARGIVHGDINPHNLFLVERSVGWHKMKIVAFGLRSSSPGDARTDIRLLGATLHELLAGTPAFDASPAKPELLDTILDRPPPGLHLLRVDVREALAAIVTRCLASDRESRFATAGELATALLSFAPRRARVVAERAALMKPAFPLRSEAAEPPSADPTVEQRADAQAPLIGDGKQGEPERNRGVDSASELGPEPAPEPTWDPDALAEAARSSSRARVKWLAIATWAGAAMLVCLTILLLGVADRQSNPIALPGEAPGRKGPEVPPSPSASLVPLPTSAPEVIEFVVRARPSSARISVDGAPVTGNPFRSLYPKDTKPHRIKAFADGYQSKSEDVTFARSVAVDLNLDLSVNVDPNRGIPAPVAVPPRRISPPSPEHRTNQPSDHAMTPPPVPTQTPIASTGGEVGSSGGRRPRRPIETSDPYSPTGARRSSGRIEKANPYGGVP
jgi:Protein kinase domain